MFRLFELVIYHKFLIYFSLWFWICPPVSYLKVHGPIILLRFQIRSSVSSARTRIL
jgi:hypothetical protein